MSEEKSLGEFPRDESIDERLFRAYIRELNTPQILPPDVFIDRYSPNISGKEI